MRASRLALVILGAWLVPPAPAGAQTLKVFFGNLHSHTRYSDGSGTPSEAYRHARERGKLDFLAVTEHNHSAAEDNAKDRKDGILIAGDPALYTGPKTTAVIPSATRSTAAGKFIALYGQEFSTISAGNHVNVFDVGKLITVPNGDFKGLFAWLDGNLDSTGAVPIVQLNHPEDLKPKHAALEYGLDDYGGSIAGWRAALRKYARLVEILTGPAMTKTPADTPSAQEQHFLRLLNLGLRVAPTADQDNHYQTWGTATDARTGVIADELTKPKLLAALRDRHVYATEDKNLRIITRVNGRLAGEVLPPPAPDSELAITLSIKDDDEPNASYEVDVFSDRAIDGEVARILDTVTFQGNNAEARIEDIRFTGPGQYLFLRIRQQGEHNAEDRAWTAPVWFDAAAPSPAPDAAPGGTAIASRFSAVYHTSADCLDARRIKEANRVTGAAARSGRTPHEGCPRKSN